MPDNKEHAEMDQVEQPRQYRRFDSLAWLIQGNDVCGAACFDGARLLLATNAKEPSPLVKLIEKHLTFVAKSSHKLCTNTKLTKKEKEEQYEALKIRQKEKVEKLLKKAAQHIHAMDPDHKMYQNGEFFRKAFEDALYKVTRSLRHTYLRPDSERAFMFEAAEAIRRERIKFISGYEKTPKLTVHGKPKVVHAELKIVNALIYRDQKRRKPSALREYYVGISKRCCRDCEHVFSAINHVSKSGLHKLAYQLLVRDEGHKRHYPNTMYPECLDEDKSVNAAVKSAFLQVSGTDIRVACGDNNFVDGRSVDHDRSRSHDTSSSTAFDPPSASQFLGWTPGRAATKFECRHHAKGAHKHRRCRVY